MTVSIQRPRVLLIDDDPSYRKLISHELRQRFFMVDAADGFEGFSRAMSSPPDLILLDMQMEGWNGLETLKRIREHGKLKYVPVIMLTSDNQRATVMEAVKNGASDYILKDKMNSDDLIVRMSNLLPFATVE